MFDLKRVRESKGLTQEELAKRIGIQRQAISAIECGIAKPTVENAKKIAEILNFEWMRFYDDKGNSEVS